MGQFRNISKLGVFLGTFLLSTITVVVLGSWGGSNSPHERKLNRFVAKTFDSKTILRVPVAIDEEDKIFPENSLFQLTEKDSLVGYLSFNRANSCRVGGCAAYDSIIQAGNYDPFYFATIYTPEFSIKAVKVIEYYSDFGYEISSKRWLRQFKGKTGCETDLEDQIDGISGATISVKSLLREVKTNCETLSEFRNIVPAQSSQLLLPNKTATR